MIYNFECTKCKHVFEVWCSIAKQHDPVPCEAEGCTGEARYNFRATVCEARTSFREDLVSWAERRFSNNPTWRPPGSNGLHHGPEVPTMLGGLTSPGDAVTGEEARANSEKPKGKGWDPTGKCRVGGRRAFVGQDEKKWV